ncbi:hypothetical protein N9B25_01345, partial [bacterium]|nr:hypothetical protein [bacterium]
NPLSLANAGRVRLNSGINVLRPRVTAKDARYELTSGPTGEISPRNHKSQTNQKRSDCNP